MDINTIFRKYDYPLRGGVLNKPLIKIRGHQCECCKNTEWLGQPITLQVHHKDGDKTNNTLENLQLLCPNCHSYTDNFGSKNNKHSEPVSEEKIIEALKNNSSIRQALFSLQMSDAGANYNRLKYIIDKYNVVVGENLKKKEKESNHCIKCGKPILSNSTYCINCYNISQRKIERPTREELKTLIRKLPFTAIGKQYGVSDNAIRKWCEFENLPKTKKEINLYTDKEWEEI